MPTRKQSNPTTPEFCPACGAEVPHGAKACPECGSDENTGWSEKARYEDLGIPTDESFDYNEFVKREFKGARPKRKNQTLWIIVAIVLLVALLLFLSGARF
jgi:uncharacterized membrane protein YvbJ